MHDKVKRSKPQCRASCVKNINYILRLEIDGSYGNLKLVQDALRKSITAAEKFVEEAEHQNNIQDEFLPTPTLSLDEEQNIAEEVKINVECQETKKGGSK